MLKKIPHTFVIVFYIIIFSAILTWVIPGGEYQEIEKNGQKEMVFKYVENQAQTWQIFAALFNGFVRQSEIIIFILMIGGAFFIVNFSKAIDVGIASFLRIVKRIEKFSFIKFIGAENIIMILIMLVFSLFGAVFGMSEETIAFIIILVPLAISMGYDSITGVNLVFVAAGLGFAGAMLNPFTIGIAQGLSGLPLFSGIEYRFFCWIIINIVGFSYILWYAAKVKKNPKSSFVYEEDEYWRAKNDSNSEEIQYKTSAMAWISYALILTTLIVFSYQNPITNILVSKIKISFYFLPAITTLFAVFGILSLRKSAHFFVLQILIFTMILLVIGVLGYQWYIKEIATLFFAMGIFSGLAMSYGANQIVKLFIEGVKDILSAALIVGLAGGIIIILTDGKVMDSILYNLSQAMYGFGQLATVSSMYVIQTMINLVIPSGSAKATLTMPIMAPFSDLVGLSRQATVMAYQFGDGFTNMITPTSGVLIAVLGVARIPYQKWFKYVLPLMIILFLLGFLLLIPTVTMKLNGF